MGAISLTINQLTRKSTPLLQVLWPGGNGEAAGLNELEAVVGKPHTYDSGYMVARVSELKRERSSAVVSVTKKSCLGPHYSHAVVSWSR